MSQAIPTKSYVEHFDPELVHHRAWLLAMPVSDPSGRGKRLARGIHYGSGPGDNYRQPWEPALSALVRPAGFGH